MLHIERFEVNMVGENCYILSEPEGESVIIDCGAFYPEEQNAIANYIASKKLHPTHLLLTHAHFDHIFGCQFIYDNYGLLPEMTSKELSLYNNLSTQLVHILHKKITWPLPPHGKTIDDGDIITFGKHSLHVIATPGHTPGGVCFYEPTEHLLFSGDSLFQYSIGRTDFPGGSMKDLVQSLQKRILTLSDNVRIYPGHGPTTSIGAEKHYNAFLK